MNENDGRPPFFGKRLALLPLIAGVLLIPAGIGFVAKFVQFPRALSTEADGGFTIVPILNYMLVTAGFVCLLVWAVAHGMFHDVEKPKYTMLEREEQIEHRTNPHVDTASHDS